MKINQIIQQKRKELSLTQEQVADYLGVSTPAVSKWENGISCPDITILPALARLLKTDLNTLLSFQENLTDTEIANFVEKLDQTIQEQDFETAFQMAVEKIQEYPSCDSLLYSVTLFLEGALYLYAVPEPEPYKEVFEGLYKRMSDSETPQIRDTAVSMLISYHRNRGEYAKAEELINTLPVSTIDPQEHLASLYMFQENYEEAKKLFERRIVAGVSEIQTALMNMMEIALKENRKDDAAFFADRYELIIREFDLPEWICYCAHLQLAVEEQNQENCLCILKKMLPAMKQKSQRRLQDSRLYRDLNGNDPFSFSNRLANTIWKDLKTSSAFAFLQGNAEFEALTAAFSPGI